MDEATVARCSDDDFKSVVFHIFLDGFNYGD